MASFHRVLLSLFIFMFMNHSYKVNSSTCTLDFKRFPYEAHGQCLDNNEDYSCCHSAFMTIFQAISLRANVTRSIFLDPVQGQDCSAMFQGLHNRSNLTYCNIEDFITSSSSSSVCSGNVDSIVDSLGLERFNVLRLSCGDVRIDSYSDDACYKCVASYRAALQDLRDGNGGEGDDGLRERVCAEALLVSLASSDVESLNWVQGVFSCLGDEIKFQLPSHKPEKGSFFRSKKLLAVILVVLSLVILAPILYTLTRKQLRDVSQKEIDNLSVVVLKNTLEEERTNPFSCSGLDIFSQDEIAKATNFFDDSGLIGEGNLWKTYLGILPSGGKVAVRRINKGVKLHGLFIGISKMAKIRHPNLISILGYCDEGDRCLVYEYCSNGNLEKWLTGDSRLPVLTWECRMQIAIGVAKGLWFLQNNPVQKLVHGDLKLTNVLLNERLEAKLSDFGISNPKTKELNSLDVLATDISHFGILLLQLLSGRTNISHPSSSASRSLINEAKNAIKDGGYGYMSALTDPRLNGAYDAIAFRKILILAVHCTAESENERPSIEQVLNTLQ